MVKYIEAICRTLILSLFIIHQCVGPPTKQKEPGKANHDNSSSTESNQRSLDDLGVEYSRYLKEVVEALESDAEFRKKLETAEEIDFRSGKVAAELEYVNHNVRTKLDELKRTELQRLKQLVKESDILEKRQNGGTRNQHDIAGHLDHANEHTFEVADLHKLITKVRLDLEEADRKRRQEFKEYEMQKQFEQDQKMKVMDEEHKKKYVEELEAQKKKHQQHEPLHHPGSKAQLEEVWEKEDHMENQKFNPKAFFHLHDLDGNGYWDEEEVKALFLKEVQKLYEAGAPEDDMRDRQEEMERMREHVFAESDTNRDRLISYSEFLEQTKKQEFERDDGWESIDQKPQFTQQEYEEFEKRRQEEIQRLIDQGLLQPYAPGMMPPPQYGAHPAQFQQHPGQAGYVQPPHPGQAGYVQPPHPGQAGYVQPPHPGINANQVPQYQYGGQVQYQPQDKTGSHHPNQIPQQHQQYANQPPSHPAQVPSQYHPAVPPPNLHPNQIPGHPNQPQVHYQNQVPDQHSNNAQVRLPNQLPVVQNPNEFPKPSMNQIPQMAHGENQQHNQIPQQIPSQVNQMSHPQSNQQLNAPDHNILSAHPNSPPSQQQQQYNNIPQRQYQSKYEPHGNKIASNEKIHQDNVPK